MGHKTYYQPVEQNLLAEVKASGANVTATQESGMKNKVKKNCQKYVIVNEIS